MRVVFKTFGFRRSPVVPAVPFRFHTLALAPTRHSPTTSTVHSGPRNVPTSIDAAHLTPCSEAVAATPNSFDARPAAKFRRRKPSTDIAPVSLEGCNNIPHPPALPAPSATSTTASPLLFLERYVFPSSGARSPPVAWN
jgi:hypothetical protein